MKLTAFILLSACMIASATGNTQSITISVKNAPLEKVFEQIKKQTGYTFLYKDEVIKKVGKVNLNVSNVSVETALQICFKDLPLTYKLFDNKTIVIAVKETTSPNEEANLRNEPPPPIDVTGKVTDTDGNPLTGANVKVKGTNNGTTTNNDGVFVLKGVDDNATLEISFVGYQTLSVAVNGKTSIVTSLKMDVQNMNEVVINKGYYTESQRNSVANVGHVEGKDISKQPVNNPLLALEGRVPGLEITQANGIPGGAISVHIQGQNSIDKGNDPLYVIDGVPYTSQVLPTNNGASIFGLGTSGANPLSYINPSDIESIDVLKDADATAIYGSRAANGAILITTKKGKAGQSKLDIDIQRGWGKVTRMMDMMNTRQYLEMRREAYKNDNVTIPSILTKPSDGNYDINGLWDTTRNTNWQKELIGGTANFTRINASVSNGTANFQYLLGATYQKETTVFPGDFSDQKGSVHFNVNSQSLNRRFKLQFSGSYLIDRNLLPQNDLTFWAVGLAPDAPSLYNSDGSLNWAPNPRGRSSWFEQPLSYIYRLYENKTKNLISNAVINYQIIPGLDIKSSFGYTNLETEDFAAYLIDGIKPEAKPNYQRTANYSNSTINSWIIEPQLDYKTRLASGDLNILIGTTIQQQNSNGKTFVGTDYANDDVLRDMGSAVTIKIANSISSLYKYNAFFGRISYALKEKYLLNLTARRDGSSRFGSKNQFHNFGGVGLAWIFSQEQFSKNLLPFISYGKIKGSFGTTGNDQIGDYSFMNLYSFINGGSLNAYQGVSSLGPNAIPNPYLQWEETKKFQTGLELGFFNDRILLAAEYVHNRSSNQLLRYDLPAVTGVTDIISNFPATVENTAWEFTLSAVNMKSKKLKWTSSFNLTIPQNKLISFPGLSTSSYATLLMIGQPIGIIRTYNFLGVNPQTGIYQVSDSSGKPTSSPNSATDMNALVNTSPKFYGGFQNSVEFNHFQLDFLLQFSKRIAGDIPYIGTPGRFALGGGNQPVDVINRWRKPGDIAVFQKYSQNSSLREISGETGTFGFGDASYMRLKSVSVSYNMVNQWSKKLKLQNCRVYMSAQNLFTITKYKGMDPESLSIQSLPPLKVFTLGLQLTL